MLAPELAICLSMGGRGGRCKHLHVTASCCAALAAVGMVMKDYDALISLRVSAIAHVTFLRHPLKFASLMT
jgi:hypothetical protein